jgi:signal transduction histidine kinase
VTLTLPPHLPRVHCDARRIAKVFDCLLSNALKYSAAGSPVRVRVRYLRDKRRPLLASGRRPLERPRRPCVEITVIDYGVGISPENLQRVFDAFYQVDMTTTRKYGGLGLGLNLARAIVHAHGGEIQVQSQPGSGSRFTVWLPIATGNER